MRARRRSQTVGDCRLRAGCGGDEDAAERERFLRDLHTDHDELYKPGFIFGRQRGGYARVASASVWAVGGAVIAPVRLEALARV